MRKTLFAEGEYYHIFNRGVDKRVIFQDSDDFNRFLLSLTEFNSVEPIGSIYEHSFKKKSQLGNSVSKSVEKTKKPLVEMVAYCLNKNHFHLILKQVVEGGVSTFMHRLGLGFTKYFNEKNKRSGSLFQGPFKAVHITSNEQLIYVGAYVNLNNIVHGYKRTNEFRSSWDEYISNSNGMCHKGILLGQFSTIKKFKRIAEDTIRQIVARRHSKELEEIILE